MKKIFIMSIITMLSSLSSCQAQNKGYKSLSADDYEKAIADTAVIRLDVRTELIRRMKRAKFARQRVEIFKPAIDTRYSEGDVVSHDSNSISSTPIDSSASILLFTSEIDVVGIDEAQFFDSGLIDVCNQLANNGVRVIIAGLDMDFKGVPFGPMPALCAIADEVSKVHAICVKCGQLASFSHRTVKNDKQVLLGETAQYEPLCRECYQRALQEDREKS